MNLGAFSKPRLRGFPRSGLGPAFMPGEHGIANRSPVFTGLLDVRLQARVAPCHFQFDGRNSAPVRALTTLPLYSASHSWCHGIEELIGRRNLHRAVHEDDWPATNGGLNRSAKRPLERGWDFIPSIPRVRSTSPWGLRTSAILKFAFSVLQFSFLHHPQQTMPGSYELARSPLRGSTRTA